MSAQQPILFLSHGSPLTALGGDELNAAWQAIAGELARPRAIVMVSAHWETRLPLIGGAAQPETIHDFGGFPAELYALRYPAPGDPSLARAIKEHLAQAGIAAGIDATRGLDHGAWVPLRALFPQADVPVLQLSVQPDLGARHHYAVGAAIAALAADGVLLIASGHMTHNLREYRQGGSPTAAAREFRDWVHARVLDGDDESLLDWQRFAPGANSAHPTPEHFLPLFVALGAAGARRQVAWRQGGWVANSLAADNYVFRQAA